MARHETDREDVFAAATALVLRAEFNCDGQIIVAGFRQHGRFTAYFTSDFMVDFDADNAIRRAYHDGLLYRAEPGRRLTRLRRQRSQQATTLAAASLSEDETQAFLELVRAAVEQFDREVQKGSLALCRVFPIELAESVVSQIAARLQQILNAALSVADGMSR